MDEANELRGSLQLIGTVKSVIFQNEENGYTVLRLDVGGAVLGVYQESKAEKAIEALQAMSAATSR